MFYSKSTKGFYTREIHGDSIPDDAVEITDAEHVALLDAQSSGKRIDADVNGRPVALDPPKPTAAQMWRFIQAERDRRKAGGFLLAGKWYHSDPESLTRYLGLVHMGANAPSRQWKTMDGSKLPMTPQLAANIFQAAVEHDSACFDAAEAHKAAMEASAVPSAYDFSTGWPEIYQSI